MSARLVTTGAALITQAERASVRAALHQIDRWVFALETHLTTGRTLSRKLVEVLSVTFGTADPANLLVACRKRRNDIDSQYDEELRYAAQFRLSPFCEYMYRDEVPAMHHEFLIDHMEAIHEKTLMRLQISQPPGSAKSTYASIRYPAWHLGRRPNDRWLQGAHTQGFAKDRLGKPVRSLIQEDRYANVFPEMRLSGASSAADYFEFHNHRGYYKAIGVGVGISGYRAEIGAIDDPIASREDAESPTARRKLQEWFEDDFSTRPMPGSPIYVVATRWHEDDLPGYLLQKVLDGKSEPWEVINIPALAGEDDPLGRAPGEGLWPEVFGTEYYEGVRRSSPGRKWNSLYQGNPVDEEGGVLKRSDVKRYAAPPADEYRGARLVHKHVRRVTLSVDCAEKATQRSDYTAATIWIESTARKHYLIHAARTKKEFTEMVAWIEELATAWGVDAILCEDRGAGTQYIQVRAAHPGPVPVKGISTKQQSKEFRFDGVTPLFTTGQVLLPETGDWIAEVESELYSFPNGRNDDYVDSVSQYLAESRQGNERRGVRKIRSSQHA